MPYAIQQVCFNQFLFLSIILSLPTSATTLSFTEMQRKPAKSIFYHTLTKALCESTIKFGKTKQIQPPLENEPDDHKNDPCFLIFWRICKPNSDCSKFEKGDCPPEDTSRIVGGVDAIPHEFPFMIRIELHKPAHCGGSLISASFFVSAVHCFYNYNFKQMTVYAGSHNVKVQDSAVQVRKIVNAQMPSGYDHKSKKHDIVMVKVDRPFDLNKFVNTIDLPPDSWEPDIKLKPTIIGWGIREWRFATGPDILQKVSVLWFANDYCETFYKGLGYYFGPDNLCAGDAGKDSCNMDSGGPAIITFPNGTRFLAGIVSFGGKCGFVPGMYTNVKKFKDFIARMMKIM